MDQGTSPESERRQSSPDVVPLPRLVKIKRTLIVPVQDISQSAPVQQAQDIYLAGLSLEPPLASMPLVGATSVAFKRRTKCSTTPRRGGRGRCRGRISASSINHPNARISES